jgi:hypothetical protein
MTEVRGSPSAAVRAVLERVVEKATARGAPPPSWVTVADREGSWVDESATASAEDRARAVVVAGDEDSLRRAIRLGLGGALWLPPSTLAMGQAFLAAAEAVRPRTVEPGLVDLVIDRGGPMVLVSLADPERWLDDLGQSELVLLLGELAGSLGVPQALVGGAALLMAEPSPGAVRSAWEGVVARVEWAVGFELRVVAVADQDSDRRSVASLAAAVAQAGAGGRQPAPRPALIQLEHGVPTPLERGVTAAGEGAVRVPVWASRRPRPGSPTGVLLERMAASCERRGVPLWIPLVDRSILPFVLRLPGRLWMDGPAVSPPTGGS